jgi:hypothetical protein
MIDNAYYRESHPSLRAPYLKGESAVKKSTLLLASLLLAPLPALADNVIYAGLDLWHTVGNGHTYADFAAEPLPAGFFCDGSAPFAGRLTFQGQPLATGEKGALGITDTIVQRLDDAVFNRAGVASTRIQVRALQFQGMAAVKTSCGDYDVRVSLQGRQPITLMKIFRENDQGGRFLAPISVDVKLLFTPASGKGRPLAVTQTLRFAADPRARWADRASDLDKRANVRTGYVQVDTDGDQKPDTWLPGTSNFAAGWSFDKLSSVATLDHMGLDHAHETVAN